MVRSGLELNYLKPIRANFPCGFTETFNPGAVHNPSHSEDEKQVAIHDDQYPPRRRSLLPKLVAVKFETTRGESEVGEGWIWIPQKSPGWNEIDAVELVGPDGRAWADGRTCL